MGAPDPSPTGSQRVAVLLVTYDSADDLPDCLAAIARQDHRPIEVVVVDCDSRDRSVEIARSADLGGLPRTVEPLGENRGFSGGMNAALRLTDAPFVLALNADARPRPDFVRRLVQRAVTGGTPKVGAITGRLVRPPGADGARRLDACGMVLIPTWRHLDRGSGELDDGRFDRAERVFGGTGAATLYRRDALDDVAFADGEIFDSLFFAYREDAELAFRLQERGWECLYEPTAIAEHRRRVVPANRSELPPAINYHSLKNRYLLRAYHQTAGNALRTLAPTLLRDLLALGYVLLRERSSWPAYSWLWRHRRTILERRRFVQRRRTAPPEAIDRWFRTDALPLESDSPWSVSLTDEPETPSRRLGAS
ncbi:MAG: glycosyltransferase family 2 protein [Acidobacteriota bacterium]